MLHEVSNKNPYANQINKLRSDMDNNNNKFWANITGAKTHINKHIAQSDVQLMSRLLTDVESNSTFESKEIACQSIEDALYYQPERIFAWLETASMYETNDLSVSFGDDSNDEPIGKGFVLNKQNNCIKEYTTNTIRLAIQKDNASPYGFTVLTAYPDMITADITPTNRNLQDIVKQTDAYKHTTPVKQCYMEYRTDPENKILATFKEGMDENDDVMTLHFPTKHPNIVQRVRFKEHSLSVATMDGHTKLETALTKRNQELNPHTRGLSVNLRQPELHDLFAKHCPRSTKLIDKLWNNLQTKIPSPEETDTKQINEKSNAKRPKPETDIKFDHSDTKTMEYD